MIGYYSWTVDVGDNAGVGRRTWSGLEEDFSWTTTWQTSHSVTGYSWAQVTYGVAVSVADRLQ